MKVAKTFGWITALAGLWEILAPFIVGYASSTGALVDALVLGALLLVFGLWVAVSRSEAASRWLSWTSAVLGVWLIVAPFIVGYGSAVGAMVNDIIVGAVVLVIEVWGALSLQQRA